MSDGTSGQPPVEDDLDRALRELTQGRAGKAKFREPSAAERAKAAKKQSELAQQQARPRASGSLALARRQERRRAARKAVSWTVAIALLAGAGLFAWDHFKGKMTGTAAGGAISAIDGQARANGAAAPPAPAGPGTDPFAGTPADHWANGAAGITVPTPNPLGPFTAAQVAGAYETTRKLLIAQTLDPATLRGGAPTVYENLLNPEERKWFISGLTKNGLDKNGAPTNTRALLTSFAPGTALIGSVIKVHGTMHARLGTDQGQQVLYVDVNYRMVYPVEPPHDPADWMRIVTMDYSHVEFGHWENPAYGAPLEPVTDFMISQSGGECGTTDGYVHPDFPIGPPDTIQPSGTPVDPYSMKVPNIDTTCSTSTGT